LNEEIIARMRVKIEARQGRYVFTISVSQVHELGSRWTTRAWVRN
jgi:hypothetical protein